MDASQSLHASGAGLIHADTLHGPLYRYVLSAHACKGINNLIRKLVVSGACAFVWLCVSCEQRKLQKHTLVFLVVN